MTPVPTSRAAGLEKGVTMNVEGKHYRTIWSNPDDPETVQIIDQTALPHAFKILDLTTVQELATATRTM